MRKFLFLPLLAVCSLQACNNHTDKADAYGNFEAVETTIGAENSGKLIWFHLEEGQTLTAGDTVGLIDTIPLYLKKQQLIANITALQDEHTDVNTQINVLKEQLANAQTEQKRTQNLLKENAATAKQMDDINGQVAVLQSQIKAQTSSMDTKNISLNSQAAAMRKQIDQVEDQIQKSMITCPDSATVLTKYAEAGEVVAFGEPLFKIANIHHIILRAYFSGDQMASIKTGMQVTVKIDTANGAYKTYRGTIQWISDNAEFTPKIIQTKDERVNLVYAVKIDVNNDGSIKIGMPGEVFLNHNHQ